MNHALSANGGSLGTNKKNADYFKFKPPRSDFTAPDWSREIFGFESDTAVAERRRIAQNSSFDSNISKKKFDPKVDVWAYLRFNLKIRLDHTIWSSFESS